MKEYRAFSDWWDEVENFSTRGERATETLGPEAFTWLHTVWNIAYRAGRAAPMTPAPRPHLRGKERRDAQKDFQG